MSYDLSSSYNSLSGSPGGRVRGVSTLGRPPSLMMQPSTSSTAGGSFVIVDLMFNSVASEVQRNRATCIRITNNNGLQQIPDDFLANHPSVQEIVMDQTLRTVTQVGARFLFNCTELKRIDIGALTKVETIGDNFMTFCSSLEQLDLSAFQGVKKIGALFLADCTGLRDVDVSLLKNVNGVGGDFLARCSGIKSLRIDKNVRAMRRRVSGGEHQLAVRSLSSFVSDDEGEEEEDFEEEEEDFEEGDEGGKGLQNDATPAVPLSAPLSSSTRPAPVHSSSVSPVVSPVPTPQPQQSEIIMLHPTTGLATSSAVSSGRASPAGSRHTNPSPPLGTPPAPPQHLTDGSLRGSTLSASSPMFAVSSAIGGSFSAAHGSFEVEENPGGASYTMNADAPLGSGGFGTVYRGFDSISGRPVAIKRVTIGEGRESGLQAEFDLLKQLDHPHIVRVIDFLLDEGVAQIVMQWMAGGSVGSLIRENGNRLHEVAIRRYSLGVLRGLAYLHHNKVLHRDIKPDNMLVSDAGDVKLTDFGLSKLHSSTGRSTNNVSGTYAYMSPESIHGRTSPKSDVWAWACSVVEMASGELPWSHLPESQRNGVPLMFFIGNATPPDHHPLIPSHLSSALKLLLERCFAIDPNDRPSAQDLLDSAYFIASRLPRDAESIGDYEQASSTW